MEGHSTKTFRRHLVSACLTASGAFSLVIAVSIFLPLGFQLDRSDLSADALGGIAAHFLYLHAAFWPVVACALAGSVAAALMLHRRMVAPLVRFVRVFQDVEDGEIPEPFGIRGRDYLRDESRSLNTMLIALAQRRAHRDKNAARMRELVGELSELFATADPRAGELLAELRDRAQEVD